MELSELTTDEAITTQPHQVFLPGCFVVLQGIAGDGLANTIESSPEYSDNAEEEEGDDDEVMEDAGDGAVEESREAPSLEEDHFSPNANRPTDVAMLVEPAGPRAFAASAGGILLSQMVANNQNPTCVLNNPVMNRPRVAQPTPLQAVTEAQSDSTDTPPPLPSRPGEDAFVVVGSEPNSPTRIRMYGNPTNTSSTNRPAPTSRRKQKALREWTEERLSSQRLDRKEWRAQQQQHHQQHQHQHQHQHTRPSPRSKSPPRHANDTDWWLDPETGYLAIYDKLPQNAQNKQIGTLSPGSTVVAHKLYTLDSETFQTIHVDEERGNDDKPPLPPSIGVVQILELQLSNSRSSSPSSSDSNLITDRPTLGYCVYSVHGYAFLVPGIPTLYMDPQVWWWRVTCKVGAFLRQGLELSSDHRCTIPYGTFVQVTRKTVNRMGLSRLRVVAQFEGKQVEGWCSEFLNPLSGQRGHVVQPLPFMVPALYRVTLPEGAVIREQVELSSRQIGHAPCGTMLTIVKRQFSEHPQDQCVERLKLAGGRDSGWISVRLNQMPPSDKCVVELVGADPRFQPNNPGDFHWQILHEERVRQQEQAPIHDDNARGLRSSRRDSSTGDLSSIDDASSSDGKPKFKNGPGGSKRKQQVETCLICLTEERNATIVHGETGHIACCLICARILKARGDRCPVCRLEIDSVIQHFWA